MVEIEGLASAEQQGDISAMTDGVRQWRPSRGERKAGLAIGLFGLTYVGLTIAALIVRDITVTLGVQSILIGVLFMVMGLAFGIRIRIVLTAETLTIVTALRTRWFLVGQVTDVHTGQLGIEFTMKDGQKARSCLVAIAPRERTSRRPGVKRRLELAREIEGAVLTTAIRARTQQSGLILPPLRTGRQESPSQ
jgi:hypothetical protein